MGIDVVADDPVPGAAEFCREVMSRGYKLIVLSTRFCDTVPRDVDDVFDITHEVVMDPERGKTAVRKWMEEHGFPHEIEFSTTKPPASLYVDDRGFRFDGDFGKLLDFVGDNPDLPTWVPRVRKPL
jgi:hypothetical protein